MTETAPADGIDTADPAGRTRHHGRSTQNSTREIVEILKATIKDLDYTWNQREGTIDIIARWMNLNASQAGRVYDSVRDTYSKNGIPSEDQAKAYIAMLSATASLKGDISANSIFDFSLAAEAAKEMTGK